MSLEEELKLIPDCSFYPRHDLSGFTTMRLKSVGDLLEVKSVEALKVLLPILRSYGKKYLVIGWGANQILPPVCEKVILHLDFPFDETYLSEVRDQYKLVASIGLNKLTGHAVKFGLLGWEVFTGIPASLGGAIFMNAGTNLGEIGQLVRSVEIVTPDGEIREEIIGPESFSYRKNHFLNDGEVIVGATLIHRGIDESISQKIKDYLDYRKKTQPLATKNCGCVFKNPSKNLQAGRLIDQLGLKGLTLGGLRISTKHANFIENIGEADWEQFITLVNLVQSLMNHFYGIEFELEVKIPYD